MFDQQTTPEPSEQGSVETRLLLLGLWRRRGILCAAAAISIVLGLLAGKYLANRTFSSQTTLMYDPAAFHKAWDRDAMQASSLVARANGPQIRKQAAAKLNLPERALDRTYEAEIDRDSGLLRIRAESPSPRHAQEVVRAVRDVLLHDTRETLLAEKAHEVDGLRERLGQATTAVSEASAKVRRFLTEKGVTIADLTLGQPAGTLSQLQMAYTEAQGERDAMRQELNSVRQTMAMLASRIGSEQAAARASAQAALNASRSQALLAMVEDERMRKTAAVDLRQGKLELERAERAYKQGLISLQEYERSRAAYDKAQASMKNGADYDSWKRTATELTSANVDGSSYTAPSETMMEQLRVQAHTLQLQVGMLDSKARRLQLQYLQAAAMARRLPQLQQQYDALAHTLAQRQAERNELETKLARADQTLSTPGEQVPGLSLVADAEIPTKPMKSRAKMIAVLVAGAGMFLAVAAVVLLDLRDKRLRMPAQLESRLAVPVLGAIPVLSKKDLAADNSSVDYVAMARRLRAGLPQKGARVLLTSPNHGEGKSMAAQGLARALAASRESVLLIDAEVHADGSRAEGGLASLIPPHDVAVRGLDDYLLGRARSIDDVIYRTKIANITCIPLVDRTRRDMLASDRMQMLLEEASRRYDIVLIEGPPLDEDAHVERLAESADGTVLVVANYTHDARSLQAALDRLQSVKGAIVTKVERLYMEQPHPQQEVLPAV